MYLPQPEKEVRIWETTFWRKTFVGKQGENVEIPIHFCLHHCKTAIGIFDSKFFVQPGFIVFTIYMV